MVEENWRPGLKDAECYFARDPTCGFVGEVNGKPVGCVTLTKYGDTFGFIGCYTVSKKHRGKGYGKAIFDAALSSVWGEALEAPCAGCIIASREDVLEDRLWKCILWNTLWSAPSHCCWMLVWHIAGLAVEYQVPGRSGVEDTTSLWQPSVRISKACILVQMALCTG